MLSWAQTSKSYWTVETEGQRQMLITGLTDQGIGSVNQENDEMTHALSRAWAVMSYIISSGEPAH